MTRLHVVPDGDRWAVKLEGSDSPQSTHGTQAEAEKAAKSTSGVTEVIIHGRDGKIRDSDTMDRAHEGPGRDKVH
ncbi:DUF2188 domain-containing protein [Capillimicrobium parvum]|uniref:DUF2188 domain-containing protein n=1 Tax=Capillimicrobium parvum TaxID=2884022 RepID=A0A9E6XVK9_9ACTN|nr:DUF2188 domain-containing protein [Capillimicrobium parvum]UGS35238.1 hypothetical protein DSM104329_01624 [Capillimicrobium parvum]